MKITTSRSNPVNSLRYALQDCGLRTHDEWDELVTRQPEREIRVQLVERTRGHQVRCFVSVPEERLQASGIELFNELAAEGQPIVAMGAGRRQVSFEFSWSQPPGSDWQGSAQRIQDLTQRIVGTLLPEPDYRARWTSSLPVRAEPVWALG